MGHVHAYDGDGITMRGYRAMPDDPNGAALLVLPAFAGLRAFEMARADRFAALGYAVLAVDYYGDGWTADSREAAAAAMAKLNADRAALLCRTEAALAQVSDWGEKVGALGFCFGGKAVLDMARAGHLDAAVSLHGVYDPPPWTGQEMPPVLLCHGWNDPLADPAAFGALAEELEAHSPDWHAVCFGQTGHAFTNPDQVSDVPGMGYIGRSAARSWVAVEAFLDRILLPSDPST
ncbi:MAG: dienelactone hydrolase family protein [Pseudomonadota bacterium]